MFKYKLTYCANNTASSASLILGLGIKTALQLGLYEDSDTPIPELSHLPPRHQLEIKRRIWWMIQLLDAFVSSSNGEPRWIQEADIRVALPSDESIWTRALGPPSEEELEDEALQISIMSSPEEYYGGLLITDALAAHSVLVRENCVFLGGKKVHPSLTI